MVRASGLPLLLPLLMLTMALRYPLLDDPFHGDDYVAFTEFKTKSFLSFSKDAFLFNDANFYWRPLGKIFHRAIYEGFGLDPLAFRVAGLAIFLATLVGLYAFCIRARLGRPTALAAVAAFGLLPNHVVSVGWVTNTSRLMAVLFFVCSLLLLQTTGARRRYLWEISAWLLFLSAVLSDETTLALTPLLVLYSAFIRDRTLNWKSAAMRLLAGALVLGALMPIQFGRDVHNDPRVHLYGFGHHVPVQIWALVSQLVLPLTAAKPIDILLPAVPQIEWGAGIAAIVGGFLLLFFGSSLTRILVIWTALALAPFSLWDLNYTSPRYVYMACIPYSVILSWSLVTLISGLLRFAGTWPAPLRLIALPTAKALLVSVSAGTMMFLVQAFETRSDAWSEETAKYGLLAQSLERALPRVPPGSRIIIMNGNWPDFWATSIAKTIYGDPSIRVVDIPPEQVKLPRPPFTKNDRVVNFTGKQLITTNPSSPAQ
jgi:hypothetical protein